MSDPRIKKYCEAALLMQQGKFDVELPLGAGDDISHLGAALQELGRSLENRFNELKLLVQLTEKINSGVFLYDVLRHIFDSFHAIIPYNRIGCALIDQTGLSLTSRWAFSTETRILLGPDYTAPLSGSSLENIIKTGEPRILNDLDEYLQNKPGSGSTRLIVEEGYHSSLTCPLIAKGKPIGFLFFSSIKKNTYQNTHAELFQELAGQVSSIIEKSSLYGQLLKVTQELEQRNNFIRQIFGRYVSIDVVNQFINHPDTLDLGGEKRTITALMTDLRGFTAISEKYDPHQVVLILNSYFSALIRVIERYNGIVEDFIGDAVFVVFGALESRPDDADRAIECALEMQRALVKVNEHMVDLQLPVLEMGVAIHSGEAVVGNIGSLDHAKYGVIGQTVNITARIESCTVGGQVLISSDTRAATSLALRYGTEIAFYAKGVGREIRAVEVLGIEGGAQLPDFEAGFQPVALGLPLLFVYRYVEDKRIMPSPRLGKLSELSRRRAVIESTIPLRVLSEICFDLVTPEGFAKQTQSFAKVLRQVPGHADRWLIHFTALSRENETLVSELVRKQGEG